eukprot:scaffold1378_cov257-Pinguiococcus_pyrenoidosus.AAC.10
MHSKSRRPDVHETHRGLRGRFVSSSAELDTIHQVKVGILEEHLQADLPQPHAEVVERLLRLHLESLYTACAIDASRQHLAIEQPRARAAGAVFVVWGDDEVPLCSVPRLLHFGAIQSVQQRLRVAMRLGDVIHVLPVLLVAGVTARRTVDLQLVFGVLRVVHEAVAVEVERDVATCLSIRKV